MTKKKRFQLILLIVLFAILAVGLAVLKLYQKNTPTGDQPQKTVYQVTDFEPESITEISIIHDNGSTDLKKAGDAWKSTANDTISIDASAVTAFLESTASITSTDKIEDATDLSQYGLDQPQISVTLKGDENMFTIKIGDYNSIVSSYYLAVNDEKVVYTTDSTLYDTLNQTTDDFILLETEEAVSEDNTEAAE